MNAISTITSDRRSIFSEKELTDYFRWARYHFKTIIIRAE